jgi:hypothetical protein
MLYLKKNLLLINRREGGVIIVNLTLACTSQPYMQPRVIQTTACAIRRGGQQAGATYGWWRENSQCEEPADRPKIMAHVMAGRRAKVIFSMSTHLYSVWFGLDGVGPPKGFGLRSGWPS